MAHCNFALSTAVGVWSTCIVVTRVYFSFWHHRNDAGTKVTYSVGIADVPLWTQTFGIVADNSTEGIGTTGAWTRVTALLINAGKS